MAMTAMMEQPHKNNSKKQKIQKTMVFHLFSDDESDYIETELDDDTVSTQEHHRTRKFISI